MIEFVLIAGAVWIYDKAKNSKTLAEGKTNSWNRFDHLFRKYGTIHGVDWHWLKAIALNESNLGQEKSVAHGLEFPHDIDNSKSYDGLSWGLMQVTLNTARDMDPYASPIKLNDPEYSINLAAQYLAKLKTYFVTSDGRTTEWIIKSYNQGPGNTRKEINGQVRGYASEYWSRFQRNLEKVRSS